MIFLTRNFFNPQLFVFPVVVLIILYVDFIKSECTSDLLRDYAVDACNHINKRSALPEIYKVEDLYGEFGVKKKNICLYFC